MTAPDKIYVKEFDEGISQMWSSIKATETTAHVQHEYIRKDALISLIESRIGEIMGDAQPAPILRAELRELINKI